MTRTALIAGAGGVPATVAACLPDRIVANVEGFVPEGLAPDLTFPIEHLGATLANLRDGGCAEACLVGALRRPALDPARLEPLTVPLVPRIAAALPRGDDALLREVIAIVEEAGLAVRGAHEVAPDLLPPEGVLGAVPLPEGAQRDAVRAAGIVEVLGAADVGQGCVVARGQALALEALGGTDWMLRSLRDRVGLPPGGLLYKAPKPGQDLRVDMPTIGPDTIRHAAEGGLAGVVIAAGGVMCLDRAATIAAADAAGLYLWVRP
ncbi:MAG: LpxI family protein [Shimia sp.]